MEEVKDSGRRLEEQRAERNRSEMPVTQTTQANDNSQPQAQTEKLAPTPTDIPLNLDLDQVLTAVSHFNDLKMMEMGVEEEPKMWKEAQRGPDAAKWEEAYREKIKSLKDMGVYRLIPRSSIQQGQKV